MVNRILANNLNLDGIPINTSGAYPIKSQRIILNNRPPTVNDKSPQYNIGTIWVVLNRSNADPDKYQYWYLADNALSQPGNVANAMWLRFATGSSGVFAAAFPTDDGNTAVPANNILNIFGSVGGAGHTGDNINTTSSGNTVVVHLNKSLHMPQSNASGTEGVWYTSATGSPLAGGNPFISNPGTFNTFIGELSGNLSISTGSNNTSLGSRSLFQIDTGNNNVAIGYQSGAITSGSDCVFLGYMAGFSNTTGSRAILIGSSAGKSLVDPSSNGAVAIGYNALSTITNWSPNNVPDTAIGYRSLESIQTPGGACVAVGPFTLQNTTTGTECTAIGEQSLRKNTTGSFNTNIGGSGLSQLTTGSYNTACGFRCGVAGSGPGLLTGDRNTLLGASSGANFAGAESSNICIGASTGTAGQTVGNTGDNNTLRIGYGTGATAGLLNQAFISGIRGITTGVNDAVAVLIDSAGQMGTVSSSLRYKKDVEDIGEESELIYKLDPVSFVYKNDESNTRTYGLIAEEVNEYLPQLVVRDMHGEIETLRYQHLPILMLNEMKKLKERLDHVEKRLERCKCR